MPQMTWQYVDQISDAPTVRLDLNNGAPFWLADGWDLSPAPLRRAVTTSMLTDGDNINATAYANRTITIPLQLNASSVDGAAAALHQLAIELNRDTNILRVQLGGAPYFFRTFAAPDYTFAAVKTLAQLGKATLKIPAEPFAYGLKEILATQVVNNDPAAASNGMYFDVSGIKGDVETPLYMSTQGASGGSVGNRKTSLIAVNRRPGYAGSPFILQCETMTQGTDTSVQVNDANMSGAGNNYSRCTFATPGMSTRLIVNPFPASAGIGVRGTYRLLLRVRPTTTDPFTVQAAPGNGGISVTNDPVVINSFANGIRWIDLGLWTWPYAQDPVEDGISGSVFSTDGRAININASRASGAGSLDFDVLMAVPADDRLAFLTWPYLTGDTYILDPLKSMVYAVLSNGVLKSEIDSAPLVGLLPYVTPGVGNRIVFGRTVGALNGSFITDGKGETTTITPYYWPRYLTIRPVAG